LEFDRHLKLVCVVFIPLPHNLICKILTNDIHEPMILDSRARYLGIVAVALKLLSVVFWLRDEFKDVVRHCIVPFLLKKKERFYLYAYNL
jgi:hypothetical protein